MFEVLKPPKWKHFQPLSNVWWCRRWLRWRCGECVADSTRFSSSGSPVDTATFTASIRHWIFSTNGRLIPPTTPCESEPVLVIISRQWYTWSFRATMLSNAMMYLQQTVRHGNIAYSLNVNTYELKLQNKVKCWEYSDVMVICSIAPDLRGVVYYAAMQHSLNPDHWSLLFNLHQQVRDNCLYWWYTGSGSKVTVKSPA